MDEELDSGFEMSESFSDCSDGGFDVDSIMDEAADMSDFDEFSFDSGIGESTLDVDAIMDEAAMGDEPELFADVPEEEPVEEAIEEIPAKEPVEEAIEEIPAEEPVEEAIEEIPVEEPIEEAIEEIPVEEPIEEAIEEIPEEEPIEEAIEEIPVEEPIEEAIEEIPAEEPIEEAIEEIPEEEPIEEAIEEIPEEEPIEEAIEEIPVEEPIEEAIEEIPVEEPITEAMEEIPEERVYDEFEETVRLDQEDFYDSGTFYTQGVNEYGYTGTCGETSMASTMNRVLGTNEYTENKVLDVAVQEGLCDTDSFEDSGGTTTDEFMQLYERMNEVCGDQLEVERHDFEDVLSMEEVAQRLDEGCTLNVAVDSSTLWGETDPMGAPELDSRATDHWITVTGVQRGEDGSIQGFDIIDSGGGESYVDADKYEAMCYGTDSLELTDPTCIVVSKKDVEPAAQEVAPVPQEVAPVPQDVEPAAQEVAPVADVPVVEEPVRHFDPEIGIQPNDTYESNGYIYKTDDQGRIVNASGELRLDDNPVRDPDAQLAAGGDNRALTDDGGHLIGARFGGSPGLENMVAENSFINRSQFKRLENAWARDLEAGNRVFVDIEPYYEVGGQRPTHIAGSYTVVRPDGSSFKEHFSFTNEDLRAPEFQDDFGSYDDFDDGAGDTYGQLSAADQLAYQQAMEEKTPRWDECRVFTKDPQYEQFAACPEDSDAAFELQRDIHQPSKKQGGAV